MDNNNTGATVLIYIKHYITTYYVTIDVSTNKVIICMNNDQTPQSFTKNSLENLVLIVRTILADYLL